MCLVGPYDDKVKTKEMAIMGKANREMDAAFALEVLEKVPYVTVSMMRKDGTPYGLPLPLVRMDDTTFYFHCAMEGGKLDCIASSDSISISRDQMRSYHWFERR